MKPAAFAYHAPETLDEAFAILARHGDEARVLAGGQSLVPMMNLRLARPAHVVDINRVPGLAFIRDAGDRIEIGAMTRHYEIENSRLVARACPILAAAAREIGHYAIRQRGTIGGSLAHADPAAEWPLMAALFAAEIDLASAGGKRALPAAEFQVSIFTTALKAGEMVTGVVFATLASTEGWGFRSFSRRVGDFAIASAATTIWLDERGRVGRLRIALGGVNPTPLGLIDLAASRLGQAPGAGWAAAIAREAAASVDPQGDHFASGQYRRELVEVLLEGALADALSRAREG